MASIRRVVTKFGAVSGAPTQSMGAVTAGDCLVTFVVGYNGTPPTDCIEDDINGTWGAPVFSYGSTINPDDRLACYVKRNSGAGTPTMTMNIPGTHYYTAFPYVVIADPNCHIQFSSNANGSGTTGTSGSITPRWGSASMVALAGLTHNFGNPDFTPDTGWTLGEFLRDWSNAPTQPGASQYRTYSSASAISAITTFSVSVTWMEAMILISDPPPVYLVMGGTEIEGWFGHDGKGGPDHSSTVVFNPPVPAGAAIVSPQSTFGFNPTTSNISDDGGNTWVIDKQEAYNSNSGDGNGASVTVFRSILTAPCSVLTYTGPGSGNPGGYGQHGAYVFNKPDTVNGFLTVTPISGSQKSVSNLTAGSLAPDTDDCFFIFIGNNRGHTDQFKPYTKPSGYTTADLVHSEIDGDDEESAVHNSITQSGWWFGKHSTDGVTENAVFGFSAATAETRTVLIAYNILGGSPISGGTTYDEQITLGASSNYSPAVQRTFGLNLTLGAGASAGPGGGNSIPRSVALAGLANAITSQLITVAGQTNIGAQVNVTYAVLRNSISTIGLALQSNMTLTKQQQMNGALTLQALSNIAPSPVQQALNIVALNTSANLAGGLSLIRSLQIQLSGVAELSASGGIGTVVHDFMIALASNANFQVNRQIVLNASAFLQGQANFNLSYQLQLAQTVALAIVADIETTRQSIVGALLQLGVDAQVAMMAGRSFTALVELSVLSTLESLEGGESGPALETLRFTLEVLRTYGFTQERFR